MDEDLEVSGDQMPLAEGWYPVPSENGEKWLRYWDGEDWSGVPARLASKKEREELRWPEPPVVPGGLIGIGEGPKGPRTLEESGSKTLDDVILLGGHGFPLTTKTSYGLEFGDEEISVSDSEDEDEEAVTIPYADVTDFSVGGPGQIKKGGGFIGGGFGIEGFAIGAGVASVLNTLTTRRHIETIIGLRTETGEMVFLCSSVSPKPLELELSRARALMRSRPAETKTEEVDVTAQLSRLADLVDRGFLERDEFNAMKLRLLSD